MHASPPPPDRRAPAIEPNREWLSLREAREILDLTSEDVVQYWAGRGYLRSRTSPEGEVQVLRSDVLYRKQVQADVAAFGDNRATPDDEMSPEELDALEAARPGTVPWKRDEKARPAA